MASTTTNAELVRALGIRKGAAARLTKELAGYTDEAASTAAKVAAMRASGADEHDIKHAENIAAESALMVPDTRQRLAAAAADLRKLLDESDLSSAPEADVKAARDAAEAAEAALSKATADGE